MIVRKEILDRYRKHVNSGTARLSEMMATGIELRSSGNFVFDDKETKYLDCGGYSVFFLGHCHPDVVSAVQEQLQRHPMSTRLLVNEQYASAAEVLAKVAPQGLDYVWFANSGAEATEAAVKLAWLGGCEKLIAMDGGYHGKTLGALSVTNNPTYRLPFKSLLSSVSFVSYGDAEALEKELDNSAEKCCVILEPVQSERGVVIPPDGYLKQVEESCQRHQATFILDEISTGMGRMGCWWGADREGVVPDILLAGKALSGGVMPVSAAICSADAYARLNQDPFLHTSTFAGNPLAAVAARTTVEVIQRDGLVQRSKEIGERLLQATREIFAEHCPHLINEVRGLGLLVGIDFKEDHYAGGLLFELMQRHVIVSHSLNSHHVVRLTPSVLLEEPEFQWLTDALRDSAIQVAASN